jgi:flagellar biosynthesis protein FliR
MNAEAAIAAQDIDFGEVATYGSLIVARLIPIVGFTPLFGGEAVSRRMRTGLAIMLIIPIVANADTSVVSGFDRLVIGFLILKELLIGAVMAMLITAVFETLAATGSLLDLARGQSMASVLDPQSRQNSSPLSVFLSQAGLVLFLTVGGYHVVGDALVESLVTLPPERLLTDPDHVSVLFGLVASTLPRLFLVAVKLALPTFAVAMIVDVAFGLLGRAAPNIQSYFLAMPLRALLGFLATLLTLQVILETGRIEIFETVRSIASGFGL